jgi:hypothetical protein
MAVWVQALTPPEGSPGRDPMFRFRQQLLVWFFFLLAVQIREAFTYKSHRDFLTM